MKNRMYRTNRFSVSRASSCPNPVNPPHPCLRSLVASLVPEKGNYWPLDEEMMSSSSKLHTQSRIAGTRSYCYSSPTRWCQGSSCSCHIARSTLGRSRSRRLPPTKGWPLIWKRSNGHSDLSQVSTSSVAH